ncbi:hypothetical protein [Levilactobacillus bambusae]|uniref:Uncharacterized protein n=1 Tax=Levilactobacillus bambusae TaxID=2024736 RepID=A0A2V1MZ04_9LACO|nr:hypothetical protein [Levilactobacillus bambusae]PWF99717.1 hypothetical protein DCM90_06565 [Levilactobacillus bambusae]
MDYEIVNTLRPPLRSWRAQKERLQRENGILITLAPDINTYQKSLNEHVNVINIIDRLTKRSYDPTTFLAANQIPLRRGVKTTRDQEQLVIVRGRRTIGRVEFYENSVDHVHLVTYLDKDDEPQLVEEYAEDGKLFSRSEYLNNQLQSRNFYNDAAEIVVTFTYRNNTVHAVTVEDPNTRQSIISYSSLADFMTSQVAEIVQPDDWVGVLYMDVELFALAKTLSTNVLYMEENPINFDGKFQTTLAAILTNEIQYIRYVVVDHAKAAQVAETDLPTDKLVIK